MERHDHYSISEGTEIKRIPWYCSSKFRLFLFSTILFIYGMVFAWLYSNNMLYFLEQSNSCSDLRRDFYNGYSYLSQMQNSLSNYKNYPGDEYLADYQLCRNGLQDFIILLNSDRMGVYSADLGILCEKYIEAADQLILSSQSASSTAQITLYENTKEIYSLITAFSSYSFNDLEDQLNIRFINLNQEMQTRLKNISRLFILTTIVIAALVFIFLRYFLNPVEDLTRILHNTTTSTWEIKQISVSRKDEIGQLYYAFYHMMNLNRAQSDQLFRSQKLEIELQKEHEKNIRAEALISTSRLKIFQSQINSHFLFNTLNMISRMAYIEHAPKVQHASNLLAQFLRSVLNQFNCDVTLAEEFDTIDHYTEIQKLRFGDRFSFQANLDPEIDMLKIPSMTLQPLVENSIIHGLADKKQGFIEYGAKCEENHILLYVWDDGIGMSEKERISLLDELSCSEEPENDVHSNHPIGLRNVYSRLQLSYPGRVSTVIETAKNEYTMIGFRITKSRKTGL